MAYKILDLYRDLPGTNCGECGKAACFAFAGAVFLEGHPLAACPHLAPEAASAIGSRLGAPAAERPGGDAKRLAALLERASAADWGALARGAGADPIEGRPAAACLDLLGRPYRVGPEGVRSVGGEPSDRVKIILLDYLLRPHSKAPCGTWVAYRSLPGTQKHSKAWRACVDRLSRGFAGRLPALDRAAHALAARKAGPGSSSRSYVVRALPRVDLLLLFWDREEDPEGRAAVDDPAYGRFVSAGDFEACAEVRVDATVPDHLGPEGLYFLAEALVDRLLAEGTGGEEKG